jgi:hypothetical protein
MCILATTPHSTLTAQPCLTIEWDVTLGGSDNDLVTGAAVMPDGRYILAGSTNSPASGEVSEAPYGPGTYDAWAVCLNPDGSISWEADNRRHRFLPPASS